MALSCGLYGGSGSSVMFSGTCSVLLRCQPAPSTTSFGRAVEDASAESLTLLGRQLAGLTRTRLVLHGRDPAVAVTVDPVLHELAGAVDLRGDWHCLHPVDGMEDRAETVAACGIVARHRPAFQRRPIR